MPPLLNYTLATDVCRSLW